jgi:hypothetical protein
MDSSTVRSFDWLDFYHNWKGDQFFEWLRTQLVTPGEASNGRQYDAVEGMTSKLSGEIELNEAYFGGRRKGRRGRGAAGKSVVFGLLERDGRVYTKVVEHVSADTLMAHIQTTTRKGSVYYTDAFRGY